MFGRKKIHRLGSKFYERLLNDILSSHPFYAKTAFNVLTICNPHVLISYLQTGKKVSLVMNLNTRFGEVEESCISLQKHHTIKSCISSRTGVTSELEYNTPPKFVNIVYLPPPPCLHYAVGELYRLLPDIEVDVGFGKVFATSYCKSIIVYVKLLDGNVVPFHELNVKDQFFTAFRLLDWLVFRGKIYAEYFPEDLKPKYEVYTI